jgi:hypothetical protein
MPARIPRLLACLFALAAMLSPALADLVSAPDADSVPAVRELVERRSDRMYARKPHETDPTASSD